MLVWILGLLINHSKRPPGDIAQPSNVNACNEGTQDVLPSTVTVNVTHFRVLFSELVQTTKDSEKKLPHLVMYNHGSMQWFWTKQV